MTESILFPLVAAGIVLVAVLAVAVLVFRDPKATTRRVEALFRRSLKPARRPGDGHYYKTYWS
jgi:hypothetical protein